MYICACTHLFWLNNLVVCSVGQYSKAERRIYTCFSVFVENLILGGGFSIGFLPLFYVVLSLLELYFDICFL